ncbi:IS3 family transposase [bacterium]|nr:IS3 family transposase [bacterium]
METFSITERRACRTLSVSRNTYWYTPVKREDEELIRERIIEIVTNYGRVGYRMVTDQLRNQGCLINYKRVYRIWREVGLALYSN